ncbi:hypothetical protein [Tranquillimonas alkanivorans]|uniref:Uncharacterized protein n=1 Tax=Tranquillimonas alkanivorans TaxID=441119 RepID=A0A1I5TN61_9RHOB|nr:hypothetical protein [Tranquillimonas alkanivorans]SFP84489.1 hypothetical protein SAMN04488047_11441 [Tranquillimonas alkanivorans]
MACRSSDVSWTTRKTTFLNYGLLARRRVRYGYLCPFPEALADFLMIAGALIWIAAPVATFIGAVGAISIFKAVAQAIKIEPRVGAMLSCNVILQQVAGGVEISVRGLLKEAAEAA